MQPTTNPGGTVSPGGTVNLSPVHRFDVPANLDGSFSHPALQFSRDGDSLMILQPVMGRTLGDWLLWHAPTLGLVSLLLGLLLGVAVVIRVRRRPQSPTQFYCRRCNYDLTDPGGMPPTSPLCPECGLDLARRPARLGRTATSRLVRPILACLVAAVIGAVALAATLDISGRPWSPPWMPRLTAVFGLPRLVHADWVQDRARTTSTARRWDLRTGRTSADRLVKGLVPHNSAFSTDGAYLLGARSDGAVPLGTLMAVQLDTGDDFAIPLPAFDPWMTVHALDERRFAIGHNATPGNTGQDEIHASIVDVGTRTTQPVWSTTIRYQPATHASVWKQVAVREVSGSLVSAVVVHHPADGSNPARAEVITHDHRVIPLPGAGPSLGVPQLSPDGATLTTTDHQRTGVNLIEVTLADGTVRTRPVPHYWRSEEARGLQALVVSQPPAPSRVQLFDRAGAVAADLALPPGLGPGGPIALSNDGRWCAAVCHRTTTDLFGHMLMEPEVVVWDVSDVPTPP